MSSCKNLSNGKCTKLDVPCRRKKRKQVCQFPLHYEYLTQSSKDERIAKILKSSILPEVLENWKAYVQNPRPGKKDMTGGPLERGIRNLLKNELGKLSVITSESGEEFPIWDGVRIIADCISKKEGHPIAIFSIKSWIGPAQIRETFAYAYFSKNWYGQRNMRVYMITLPPIEKSLKSLIETSRPYIDGVYSLSGKPYIDELIDELKETYQ